MVSSRGQAGASPTPSPTVWQVGDGVTLIYGGTTFTGSVIASREEGLKLLNGHGAVGQVEAAEAGCDALASDIHIDLE